MDYSTKLAEIDQLTFNGHHAQAVIAAASVLEEFLRQLYSQVQPRLSPAEQKEIANALTKIGQDKPLAQLTLGQLVGLYRETKLLDKLEKHLAKKFPRLRAADFNTLLELRNSAAHNAADVHADDARLIASQLRVWIREAGYLEEPAPTATKKGTAVETLRPWTHFVRLNADVEAGNTAIATYAIDLGAVIAGDKNVPKVYRDAESFFRATYPTASMRRLMDEVLARLAGTNGDRVLQLRSPFGGGKSHLLLALYHAVTDRKALVAHWPEAGALANPSTVRVAWFDGEKFDVTGKETAKGIRIKTLWGWLAWQLGGEALYKEVAYHDERKVAPGGDVIARLIRGDEGKPTLVLLDEVLKYFERAQADTDVVGNSTLGRQTLDFIQSLSTEVANSVNALMIYSLQASARESFGDVALLDMLDHLTARVDAKREPIQGDEILPVLQRRLLAEITDQQATNQVASAYANVITAMKRAYATDAVSRRAAEDEGQTLRKRFSAAYPFHPALIDLMSQRWASLPDFQRTRGALRFLATCLHVLKRENAPNPLLGPTEVPIRDADAQNAFFTEVGQGEAFKAVLLHDFTGPNARTQKIDDRLAREYPHLSGVHPATRLATAILMYSFGGATRAGEAEGEVIGAGVTEAELLSCAVSPDLDSLTAQATLKELREQCLYLHFDGARYVFRTTPNVTQLLEQEAETSVRESDIRTALKENLLNRLAGRAAIVWSEKSSDIPDKEPRFLIVYLPLEFAQLGDATQQDKALEYLTRCGNDLRQYRNGVALAIPDINQIEPLRRAARYLQAIELLRNKRKQLNLTPEQLDQLKEREATEKSVLESAMRNLYTTICLPQMANGVLTIEKLDIGGRPLGATGIHERLMELVPAGNSRRLFSSLSPKKIVELLRLGEKTNEGESPSLGISTQQIVDSFYSIIGFPRLEDEIVLRRAIIAGVKEGSFGFVGRADRIERDRVKEGSGYYVARNQAMIGKDLREDEIDLSAGFIVLPKGIEAEAAVEMPSEISTPTSVPSESGGGSRIIYETQPSSGAPNTSTRVHFRVTLNRQQVFATFNAFANLADKAGTIQVSVDAQALQGFDPVWLRNAVIEPLEEAEVRVEGEGG